MPKLKIIPFQPEHLEMMQPRPFEARELAALGDLGPRFDAMRQLGPAWTGLIVPHPGPLPEGVGDQKELLISGEILACCGIVPKWPGAAQAWLVSTELCTRYALTFHRAIRENLERVCRDLRLRRLEICVHAEHTVSRKWVERLGFGYEGRMPKYGPDGSDYLRYARVTWEH